MTNDVIAVRGSLRAAMSTEPRMVEAMDDPTITFARTAHQARKLLAEAFKDEPGFRLTTARRDDARAEARILRASE